MRRNSQAEHLSQYRDAYLKPDSGEEAHEHGLREKVSQKAKPEHSSQQQHSGGKQRHQSGQRYIPRACRRREGRDAAGQNGGGSGIGGHHQITRRAEHSEAPTAAAKECRNR